MGLPAPARAWLLALVALGVGPWMQPAAGQAAAPRQGSGLLELLRQVGVTVELMPSCGGPGQLATYNMGANRLCLSQGLQARPAERDRVMLHELVHVVQDCLDGLATPTSSTLAEGFRRSGSLSDEQINRFFLSYLRQQGNLRHVVATTALLPLDSRQREIEAYALQGDPALVEHLLRTSCRAGRP